MNFVTSYYYTLLWSPRQDSLQRLPHSSRGPPRRARPRSIIAFDPLRLGRYYKMLTVCVQYYITVKTSVDPTLYNSDASLTHTLNKQYQNEPIISALTLQRRRPDSRGPQHSILAHYQWLFASHHVTGIHHPMTLQILASHHVTGPPSPHDLARRQVTT